MGQQRRDDEDQCFLHFRQDRTGKLHHGCQDTLSEDSCDFQSKRLKDSFSRKPPTFTRWDVFQVMSPE